MTEESWFESWHGKRLSSSPKRLDRFWVPYILLFYGYREALVLRGTAAVAWSLSLISV
jgi:hypothetical protein